MYKITKSNKEGELLIKLHKALEDDDQNIAHSKT